ncbi:hypothetical protein PIB30_038837 [Stylosanthes scabra]|uniref:Bifunctional inhibitor/plant lipid transfer protein/seed storage helical domain-containing protein n=1 Tax=Stylosanthes scabra TaxID=79078 RepID=A0ABU6UEK5_9FABA|nr:hypothetical protein [Stylosanthes scabra]
MASMKCFLSLKSQVALMLMLVVATGIVETEMAKAQSSCTNELSNLNVCAPFVVPGASNTNPNSACCNALGSVDTDCLCNTIRIGSQLRSKCNLPTLGCAN